MKTTARLLPFTVLVGLVAFLGAASAQADDLTPRLAPIHTKPAGQTYGRWAAERWQWALGILGAVNPLTDPTGAHCAQRQVDAVWFLAGTFFSTEPVVRACEVPEGRSLFFPLINNFYGAFLNDPPETRTEAFVRAAARCTAPAEISVWIDDFHVPKPTRFFTVQLPPDNVFGADDTTVPELVLSPSAEQGYYLFVRPLSAGPHTILWLATGCVPGFSQDVTYHLTVAATGSSQE
jgi:hypothetical protein